MEGNDIMICKNCGNTTDDSVLFCPYCGKKIEEIIDFEKKSAAVNDVFSTSGPSAAPAPAFSDEPRQDITAAPTVPQAAPVSPAPPTNAAPPVTPVPAFSRAPGQDAAPVPPVTPVPAFDSAQTQNVRSAAAIPGAASMQSAPPLKPAAPVQPLPPQAKPARGKKKEFFGAGAFALCLVIIGLLSASTGVFAYLYFSLLGAI